MFRWTTTSLREWKRGKRRRELADQAGFVGGRHFTEWGDHLNELRSAGRDGEALPLLFDIIEATERASAISGREPPPAGRDHPAAPRRPGRRNRVTAPVCRQLPAWTGRPDPR